MESRDKTIDNATKKLGYESEEKTRAIASEGRKAETV